MDSIEWTKRWLITISSTKCLCLEIHESEHYSTMKNTVS